VAKNRYVLEPLLAVIGNLRLRDLDVADVDRALAAVAVTRSGSTVAMAYPRQAAPALFADQATGARCLSGAGAAQDRQLRIAVSAARGAVRAAARPVLIVVSLATRGRAW